MEEIDKQLINTILGMLQVDIYLDLQILSISAIKISYLRINML